MQEFDEREIRAATRVLKTKQLYRYFQDRRGECDRFEAELCRKFGARHALTVSSGTGALICALYALGIRPGDEVIIPAYTYVATPAAVLAVGAVPVVANVDDSLTISVADARRRVTKRTRAIIPVHVDGLPADMNGVQKLAREHGLKIIEDAAQAFGGSYRGRRLGTIGDAGCYSFNQFKLISAGEGGALVTASRDAHDRAENHHKLASLRVTEVTGAILRVQLSRLDGILRKLRQRKAAMLEVLSASKRVSLQPVHCEKGDLGVAIHLALDDGGSVAFALRRMKNLGVHAETPLLMPNFFVKDWEARLGGQRERLKLKRPLFSVKDFAKTEEILSRTLSIPVDAQHSVAEAKATARLILKAID